MRRTLIALLPLLALTTACAAPAPSSTTTATNTSEATSTPPSSAAPAASVAGLPPKPDAATQAAYIAELEAIDPDIVHGKPDKAVSRGRDQCSSVATAPTDQARLVAFTAQRFISPDHPNGFGADVSARILAAVRKHICPTY